MNQEYDINRLSTLNVSFYDLGISGLPNVIGRDPQSNG